MNLSQLFPDKTWEDDKIELKSHLSQKSTLSWAKSIVGFANANGGEILVGVSDDREAFGIPYEEADRDKTLVYEEIERHIRPKPTISFSLVSIDDAAERFVLVIRVKKAESIVRYRDGDFSERVFERKDGSTPPSGVDDIIALSRRRRGIDNEPTEERYEPGNFRKYLALCERFRQKHDFPGENELISDDLLTSDGCVKSGFALFEDGCDDFDTLVVCRLYEGLSKDANLILDRKKFKGPLGECFLFAFDFVRRNSKTGYRKNASLGRDEVSSYPESSLREAIVNAIAHRDYSVYGTQIDVDIFEDRIEIMSPGSWSLPKPPSEYSMDEIPSVRRNPIICNAFEIANLMEEDGTGFKTISLDYSFSEGRKPELKSRPGTFTIVLPDLLYEESPKSEGTILLSVEDRIVAYCRQTPRSREELQKMTGYKSKGYFLSHILNPLLRSGRLRKIGKDRSKGTKYFSEEDSAEKSSS